MKMKPETDMRNYINRIHMVGIGGSGMSGIAEVLLNLGYRVSGSDLNSAPPVRHLQALGARVHQGHFQDNVGDAQVVVKSTAIREDNPEIREARARNIPVIPRAEMLAELMRLKTGIAVAGTHGKTTTTSLLGTIFKEAGLDPTVIIGGRLNTYGSNALPGTGEYLIAEADESDGSFLTLLPIMNIVTNIGADHLDYYRDIQEIRDSFVRFMNSIPFYGLNVVCGDDHEVRKVLERINRPVLTYGLGPDNALRGEVLTSSPGSEFNVFTREGFWGQVRLNHPGRHNVLNCLGAIGIAMQAGIPREDIVHALAFFGGVGRRFERKGIKNRIQVVDDYGHHPTEIAATLETARHCYPECRLGVLFQPHRFTRTKALFGDFCRVLSRADLLLLTEIYPASEDPIPGVNGQSLAQGIRQVAGTHVRFYQTLEEAQNNLFEVLRQGDLFLTLGAGNVWQVGENYLRT